jgi:hypothetical protein
VHAKPYQKGIDRSKERKDGKNHSFIIAHFLVVVFAREAKQSGGGRKACMQWLINYNRGEVSRQCRCRWFVQCAGRVLSPLGRVRFQGLGCRVSFLDGRVQALAASKGMRLKGIIPFPFSFKNYTPFPPRFACQNSR